MPDYAKLEEYIVGKLGEMQNEKAEQMANVEPHFVTNGELFSSIDKDIRSVLNKLWKSGRIKMHPTVHPHNQDYVELIEDKF